MPCYIAHDMHDQMETLVLCLALQTKQINTSAVSLRGFLQGEDSVVPLSLLCFVELGLVQGYTHTHARKVLPYKAVPLDLGMFFLLFVCLRHSLTL